VADNKNPIVCLACHHRQPLLLQPCRDCGSRKLAHVTFIVRKLGEGWKLLLEADGGAITNSTLQ
jgi:hypothetical protein